MPLPRTDPRITYVDDRHIAKDRPCFVCRVDFWSKDAGDRFCSACRKKVSDAGAYRSPITPALEEYYRDNATARSI